MNNTAKLGVFLVSAALLLAMPEVVRPGQKTISSVPHKVIAPGEKFETLYYEFKGDLPGPTVLLEAGIHGNEPAGTEALEWLVPRLTVTRGRVLVLPRMHALAMGKKKRYLQRDLNKQFPGDARSKVLEQRLARALYEMVASEKPDLVLTLHEARTHIEEGKCCAHTVIYGIETPTAAFQKALALINQRAVDKRHQFQPYYYPIATSSSEVFVRDFGLEAYCVETWLKDKMQDRVKSHLNVVKGFMEAYGVEFVVGEPAQSVEEPTL